MTRRELPAGTDLVVLPGGFSYGDYLRCGAIAARAPIMDAVRAHAAPRRPRARRLQRLPDPLRGRPAARRADAQRRSALHLPDAASARREQSTPAFPAPTPPARSSRSRSPMARAITSPTPRPSQRLEGEGRVAFRYCDAAGLVGGAANPNGSMQRHRRRLQRRLQRPRPDAASGKPDRPAGRRDRRPRDVREPDGGLRGGRPLRDLSGGWGISRAWDADLSRAGGGCPGNGIRSQHSAFCKPSTSCPALCRASTPRSHRELQALFAAAPRGWPGQARP